MSTQTELAQTIINQIKATDFWALGSWGSSNYLALPENDKNYGGLRFEVRNCRTFKGKAFVRVELDFNDTYTVKLYKIKNLTAKLKRELWAKPEFDPKDMEVVIGEHKDVYNDQLVQIIDSLTGEK